jgi:cytochrome c-type biogenesis protein
LWKSTPAARPRLTRATSTDGPGLGGREAIAALVVFVVLGLAIGGAFLSREGELGPALAVTTLSGSAGEALQGIGEALPFGYAFAVGLAAAVNPCGFALLPGYLGLYLGATEPRRGNRGALGQALAISATMTASFVTLFGLVGFVLASVAAGLEAVLPWANLVIGVLLVVAGGRLLAGRPLGAAAVEHLGARMGVVGRHPGVVGYAAYGAAFALTSLGCTLPLFLSVVGTALVAGGLGPGLLQFVLYGLGMGVVVTGVTLLVALFGRAVVTRARRAGRWLEAAGALLLLVSGAYVVYYWLVFG